MNIIKKEEKIKKVSSFYIFKEWIFINKILDDIYLNIKDDVLKLGFEIEYIEYVKEFDNYILRIVVDKLDKSNIGTEDCEIISKTVEDKVDKLMKNEYILEISSPGFERVLKNKRLYKKYIGNKIFVKLFKKTEIYTGFETKEFEADLIDIDDDMIKLFLNDNDIYINIKDIALAHTVYDYSKSLERDGI